MLEHDSWVNIRDLNISSGSEKLKVYELKGNFFFLMYNLETFRCLTSTGDIT